MREWQNCTKALRITHDAGGSDYDDEDEIVIYLTILFFFFQHSAFGTYTLNLPGRYLTI